MQRLATLMLIEAYGCNNVQVSCDFATFTILCVNYSRYGKVLQRKSRIRNVKFFFIFTTLTRSKPVKLCIEEGICFTNEALTNSFSMLINSTQTIYRYDQKSHISVSVS